MTTRVTLELADDLLERAQKQAQQIDKPLESVLTQWLEHASHEAEAASYFTPGAQYEVWSPYDSAEAAETLWKLLQDDKRTSHE